MLTLWQSKGGDAAKEKMSGGRLDLQVCHALSSFGPKLQNLDQLMHTMLWEWHLAVE